MFEISNTSKVDQFEVLQILLLSDQTANISFVAYYNFESFKSHCLVKHVYFPIRGHKSCIQIPLEVKAARAHSRET